MTGTGSGLGNAVRKGVGLVHGSGEAIRGNVNAAVDSVSGDRESAAKNQAIASRGIDEAEHGHYHGTGARVTPADTTAERQNRAAQGEFTTHSHAGTGVGSTNYGPHTTNTGNKLDPRYDSDLDHRGAYTDGISDILHKPRRANTGEYTESRPDYTIGSFNDAPHSIDSANKLDPKYNWGQDHSGTSTEHKSTNHGPHSTNLANQTDPWFDSDRDHRDPVHGSSNNGPHSTNIANKLEPRFDFDEDYRGARNYDADFTAPRPVYRDSTLNNPRVDSEYSYFHGAPPVSQQPPKLERYESEPMLYFTSAYEDIESRPPGPLTPRPPRSHEEEAEERLQREGGRWLSNRDIPYEQQQQTRGYGHAQRM